MLTNMCLIVYVCVFSPGGWAAIGRGKPISKLLGTGCY